MHAQFAQHSKTFQLRQPQVYQNKMRHPFLFATLPLNQSRTASPPPTTVKSISGQHPTAALRAKSARAIILDQQYAITAFAHLYRSLMSYRLSHYILINKY